MRYLSQGLEDKEKILILLSFTRITSDNIIYAIYDHFCNNFSISHAANLNNCKQGNLTVAINTLNETAEKTEKLYELKHISKIK